MTEKMFILLDDDIDLTSTMAYNFDIDRSKVYDRFQKF